MNAYLIYTPSLKKSEKLSNRAFKTLKNHGISATLVESFTPKNLKESVSRLELQFRLKPTFTNNKKTTKTTAPAWRIANGLTHFTLYQKAVELDKMILIMEHDIHCQKPLLDEYPDDGVTQITRHGARKPENQYNLDYFEKSAKHGFREMAWEKGIVRHPGLHTHGTSGYVISPLAASKMIEYIQNNGISNADIISEDIVDNVYLQIPQPMVTLQ